MAVKFMIFGWTFKNFAQIRLGMVSQNFLRSLITNLKIKYEGSNMAVKYTVFWWTFNNFARIRLGMVTHGSLITNMELESHNSKYRIQYGNQVHYFLVKLWQFCSHSLRNELLGGFWSRWLRIWSQNLKIENGR